MKKLEQLYLNILNEQKSPTTFTPEELLNDIRDRCYFSHGDFKFYTINDLKFYADQDNKELFKIFINHLSQENDFGLLVIYFTSLSNLKEILNDHGYFEPHYSSRNCPINFKMQKVFDQIEAYFTDNNKTAGNFNSIDQCPELGCVIALNGEIIHSNRDFEKELDHELNHYFEKMNIHYSLKNNIDNIIDINEQNILKKLNQFYQINFNSKDSFIKDLKHHLFNYEQFRSMGANVFHEILKYNQNHIKQLKQQDFINDILNLNIKQYPINLQQMMMFCWISKSISESRWIILLKGIKEAISIKKNIFQKFWIKGRDWFRNFILKRKEK